MLGDNSVAETEAQSRSLAHTFRRVERVEYFGNLLFRNARTGIFNDHPDAGLVMLAAHNHPARPEDFFECVERVVQNVEENLLNLVRVEKGQRKVRIQSGLNRNVINLELMFHQLQRVAHHLVQIAFDPGRLPFPGECQKILDDAGAPRRLFFDHFNVALEAGHVLGVSDQFGVAENAGQGIVDLVRDARDHLA